MLNKNKEWIFYALYVTAAALLFLYILFPSEAIKGYIVSTVRKMQPDAALSIERVFPVFPPGIRLKTVVLTENELEISAEHIDVIPDLRTLFGSDTAYSFKGKGYDGHMKGRMIMDQHAALTMLHADLSDMKVGRMVAVERLTGHSISGNLSGTIDYEKAGEAALLTGNLAITGVGLPLEIPGTNLKELTFSEVNARLASDKTSNLRIESLTAKGNQVSGEMSGTVVFKTPPAGSTLDLSGTVKPHPSFISGLGDALSMFFQNRSGNNTFPFAIRGTIESAEFTLR